MCVCVCMCVCMCVHVAHHRGDQTSNIWVSRFAGVPGHSLQWRGHPFAHVQNCLKLLGLPWKRVTGIPVKTCWNCGSRNCFTVWSPPCVVSLGSTKEPYKRDLQKRPTKETRKRDSWNVTFIRHMTRLITRHISELYHRWRRSDLK